MQTKCGLRLRHAASAHIQKDGGQQNACDDTDQGWHRKQPEMGGREAEEQMAGAFNGQREEHGGEAREDANDNRQREKELVFAEAELLNARRERHRH